MKKYFAKHKASFLASLMFLAGIGILLLLFMQPWRTKWIAPVPGIDLTPAQPLLKPVDVKTGSAWDFVQQGTVELEKDYKASGVQGKMHDKFFDEGEFLNLEPWLDTEFPASAEYVASSQAALELFRKAGQAEDKRVPYFGTKPPDWERQNDLLYLFPASAAKKVSLGDYNGAYADLGACCDYGHIYMHGTAMFFILGMGDEIISMKHMRYIALQNDVPEDAALQTIRHLEKLDAGAEPLQEMFRMESRTIPEMVNSAFDSKSAGFLYDLPDWLKNRPHLLMLLAATSRRQMQDDMEALYSNLISLAGQPYDHVRLGKFGDMFDPPRDGWRLWGATADPPGYVFATMCGPLGPDITQEYCLRTAALRATEVVLAVRQFQQSEKRLPADLNELAPKYFSAVPPDPFDGKPLRYKVKQDGTWIVYSVNKSQVDHGGVKGQNLVFPGTEAAEKLESAKELLKKK